MLEGEGLDRARGKMNSRKKDGQSCEEPGQDDVSNLPRRFHGSFSPLSFAEKLNSASPFEEWSDPAKGGTISCKIEIAVPFGLAMTVTIFVSLA
jgi:hypothetical protein